MRKPPVSLVVLENFLFFRSKVPLNIADFFFAQMWGESEISVVYHVNNRRVLWGG